MTNEKPGCLYALLRLFNTSRGNTEVTRFPADFKDSLPFNLRDDFLSPAEASFFRLLQGVVKDQYLIFPKVSLKDIFFVSRPQENMTYYNKIDRKHVDFLLCDAVSLKPVMGIELDDSSHKRPDRIERDELVDQVFNQSGLPLRRISVRSAYSQQELQDLIAGVAAPDAGPTQTVPRDPDALAPTCPKCGAKMVLRTAQRGAKAGSKFYGCPNYPKCREIIPLG
jgi:predicted RNA-binding Zn-ribbon protein involved in translation (DUF1610 family)